MITHIVLSFDSIPQHFNNERYVKESSRSYAPVRSVSGFYCSPPLTARANFAAITEMESHCCSIAASLAYSMAEPLCGDTRGYKW